MRLNSFLLPALAGLAAAEKQTEAEAYLLRGPGSDSSSTTPSVSAHVADAIFQQRVAGEHNLPADVAADDFKHLNAFGKAPARLFHDADAADEPYQLVIVYKGIDEQASKAVKKALGRAAPSFTTPEGLAQPLRSSKNSCKLDDAIDPEKKQCWSAASRTQYLEFDMTKKSGAPVLSAANVKKLQALAQAGTMETAVVLDPSSASRTSANEELRRRDIKTEKVLSQNKGVATPEPAIEETTTSDFKPHPFVAKKTGPIAACFNSQNSCETATGNCSGHGVCSNKYGADASKACFACHCLATTEKNAQGKDSRYHWGGAACHKIDVSTPFWLLAGFTIVMVGVVGFSINLLFSVGEEKLPGVIGAGVSRGSK